MAARKDPGNIAVIISKQFRVNLKEPALLRCCKIDYKLK